eukprot:3807118-Pyramimonas_sp.AAC.1
MKNKKQDKSTPDICPARRQANHSIPVRVWSRSLPEARAYVGSALRCTRAASVGGDVWCQPQPDCRLYARLCVSRMSRWRGAARTAYALAAPREWSMAAARGPD